MAKLDPVTYDFDSKMLDVFTEQLERLLEAYESDAISAESALGGVRDLVILTNRVPRSVTINLEEKENA